MLGNKKIIAIIPARGGSKRLPGKNIKKLLGKPLIAWTIEVALKSKYLDRVVVSTEDKKIAEISRKYGAEVIKRSKNLATDKTKTISVIFYLIRVLKKENYNPEIIVLLQPTSPLRGTKDINNAIELFLNNDCQSVISVCKIKDPPFWCFRVTKRMYLKPFFEWKYFRMRKQDLPELYMPNGAIYISTLQNLFKHKSFYCKKSLPYIMSEERSIDIDNKIDFQLAELLLKNEKNKNWK